MDNNEYTKQSGNIEAQNKGTSEKRQTHVQMGVGALCIFLLLICAESFFILRFILVPSTIYIEKEPLKDVITCTIRNGGNLSSVKHIYETRSMTHNLLSFLHEDRYYKGTESLSSILKDIEVDSYKQLNVCEDSIFCAKLRAIIEENDLLNPFDKLENNQKYYFENLKTKLDTSYTEVAPDVIRIVDELDNKNKLVTRYLDKSEISFYVSISALIISIILSFYQIYQGSQLSKSIRIKKENK
jgi:hypothetical protein